MDLEQYRELGLYDPDAPDAESRALILGWLDEHGVSVEQMRRSDAFGSLWSAAGDAAVRPGRSLTLEELCRTTGLDPTLIGQVLTASGLTTAPGDGHRFTELDIDTFTMFGAGVEMFGIEAILEFTRVLGTSMARIAEASVTLFQTTIEAPLRATEPDPISFAETNLAGVQALAMVPRAMDGLFHAHVELAIRRSREAHDGVSPVHARRMAVGFVDLVGFTPLSRTLDERELGALIEHFERQANDLVTLHDGRVVKHIGDEVMFVAVSAAAACRIATALVDAFRSSEHRVTPHGGVAWGSLVTRGGDFYGPVVNLASRVADLAVPDEILVTAEVVGAADGTTDLRFEPAGRRMLKGFDEAVPLWAVTEAQ